MEDSISAVRQAESSIGESERIVHAAASRLEEEGTCDTERRAAEELTAVAHILRHAEARVSELVLPLINASCTASDAYRNY